MKKNLHWAFIMDGNGRWAKMRGLPRLDGHRAGVKKAESVLDFCLSKPDIGTVSLYVFSTENWRRSLTEVNGLFKIAKQYLSDTEEFVKRGVKVVFSGEKTGLSADFLATMDKCKRDTKNGKKLLLNLCLNYGGRAEILNAAKKIAETGDFSQKSMANAMYNDLPDPDVIFRTGGQMRLSNFMLYQSAYSELFFSDTLWPDLTVEELSATYDAFKQRVRKFGRVF